MHIVKEPFLANQFPDSPEPAVGIKLVALNDKYVQRFRIMGQEELYEFDVSSAIEFVKKYPPPNSNGYLHKDMIILPLSFCRKVENPQPELFAEL